MNAGLQFDVLGADLLPELEDLDILTVRDFHATGLALLWFIARWVGPPSCDVGPNSLDEALLD